MKMETYWWFVVVMLIVALHVGFVIAFLVSLVPISDIPSAPLSIADNYSAVRF